jgi:hypothetical protein
MGRINHIGKSNGIGNSPQLSLEQQQYSILVSGLEQYINNIQKNNINSNAKAMASKYPTTKSGYFGKKSSSTKMRVINTNNPIEEATNFYNNITKGYYYKTQKGNALITYLPDETIITLRISTKTSKSGESPAVDINISKSKANPKIKEQRIHFQKEKNK